LNPDFDTILEGFPKDVPVFPLPEVVLFPGAVLPLHIFEPRYKRMLEVALTGDRLIAMALLKQPRAEEFHETVCVGHVIHTEPLPEGRSHIALLGLSAGRAKEVGGETDEPYRTVKVDLLDDEFDTGAAARNKLEKVLPHTVPGAGTVQSLEEQLEKFIAPERISAALINTCALSAPILPFHKLELLEERSLARRLDLLIDFIERPWQWN
jgi:Lon protease-like protein